MTEVKFIFTDVEIYWDAREKTMQTLLYKENYKIKMKYLHMVISSCNFCGSKCQIWSLVNMLVDAEWILSLLLVFLSAVQYDSPDPDTLRQCTEFGYLVYQW